MHLSCETPLRPPRRVRAWLGRGLAGAALAWSAMACADSSSIIIEGKDNWLFPGWGSLTHVDTAGIDASAALVTEARSALMARDIRLVVLLVPDKARFYRGQAAGRQIHERRRRRTLPDRARQTAQGRRAQLRR